MKRWLILACLLLLPSTAVAESPGASIWSDIHPVVRSRMIQLERSEAKEDLAKAKALGKLLDRWEKPRSTIVDDGKFALRISKALRRKLADDLTLTSQFDWAFDRLEQLIREGAEDATFWAESLSPSRARDRALACVEKAGSKCLDAGQAIDRHGRVRLLARAASKLHRAEKRLAKLGSRPAPVPAFRNAGFETGTEDGPDAWTTWAPAGQAVWESGEDGCVRLGSEEPEFQYCWYQSVRNLVPGRWYNVTARVRGENIVVHDPEPGTRWGACLELYMRGGAWRSDRGSAYQGTFEEKEVTFTFQATEEREAIALQLGAPGFRVSGYAWFDDVRISGSDWMPGPPEGDHIRLHLEAEDVESAGLDDAWLAGWIRHLDHVYQVYTDLVGGVPYDGAKIDIVSVRQYPGGWAVAGNPIRWQRRYVPGVLERFRLLGDWSFGILHEIGHDFDLDYRWVYQAEVQANFKMVYALDQLGGAVSQRGVLYPGGTIRDFYADVWQEAKDAGEVTSWGGWLHRVLEVQKEIGWEPFRKMYRSYPAGSRTRRERFELFFDELERHSGRDIRGTLIPADELAWVREQLD